MFFVAWDVARDLMLQRSGGCDAAAGDFGALFVSREAAKAEGVKGCLGDGVEGRFLNHREHRGHRVGAVRWFLWIAGGWGCGSAGASPSRGGG